MFSSLSWREWTLTSEYGLLGIRYQLIKLGVFSSSCLLKNVFFLVEVVSFGIFWGVIFVEMMFFVF